MDCESGDALFKFFWEMIDDHKSYTVKQAFTPNGPLVLSGRELKKRPDLDGRYVYEDGVRILSTGFKMILFDYELENKEKS